MIAADKAWNHANLATFLASFNLLRPALACDVRPEKSLLLIAE